MAFERHVVRPAADDRDAIGQLDDAISSLRRNAFDAHLPATGAPGHPRLSLDAVDHDVEGEGPPRSQCESIIGRPWAAL